MTEKTKYECDKCGLTKEGAMSPTREYPPYPEDWQRFEDEGKKIVDLCPSCQRLFEDWLEED